jgi:hypothetical protein
VVIQITDDLKAQTNISAGSRIRGAPVQNAFQIQGWLEVNGIFFRNAGLSIMIPPFGVGGGDCLFDTGSLFIFAGPQNSDADNVLMVLWGFQLHPASGDQGDGQLNVPPSNGALDGGSISWQIQ